MVRAEEQLLPCAVQARGTEEDDFVVHGPPGAAGPQHAGTGLSAGSAADGAHA